MLSAIFDQASKSITRAVLYAGLVPLSAVMVINAALAALLLGDGARVVLNGVVNQSATAMAGWVLAGVLLLTIASIAVASLAPVFRMVLEGRPGSGILSTVFAEARAGQQAEVEQRRADRDETRQLLTRGVRFRASEEGRMKAARRAAPERNEPPPERLAALRAEVEDALAASDSEQGVSAAIDLLVRHFGAFGAGGTYPAYAVVLDRLDALVDDPRRRLAGMARASADIPVHDAAVTRYGRELQVIQTYVASVYNIDSIVFWTRLQHVIPASFAARLEDAKHALDLLSCVTMLLWISLAVWMVVIPMAFPGWRELLAVAIVGWLVSYVAYRAATAAALSFAELVCAAFDLFRRDLLMALAVQPPVTLREERAVWLKIGQLVIYRQEPDELKLRPHTPASAGAGTGVPVPSATGTIPIPVVTKPAGS